MTQPPEKMQEDILREAIGDPAYDAMDRDIDSVRAQVRRAFMRAFVRRSEDETRPDAAT